MGKWIRKVLETPIETKGNIIDALGGTKDERANAPSIRAVKEDVFNLIYPVGSIYMSANNVSPATLFGGEWESLENRFLIGAGSGYSAGSKGGSDSADISHTHTMNHKHDMGHTHTMAHIHNMEHTHPFNLPDHQHIGSTGYDPQEFYWSQPYGSEVVDTQSAYVVKTTYQQIGKARLALTSGVHGAVGGNTGASVKFTGDASTQNTGESSASYTGEANNSTTGGSSKGSISTVPPYLAVYMWKRVA